MYVWLHVCIYLVYNLILFYIVFYIIILFHYVYHIYHLILSVFGLCILGVCWRFVYLCSCVRSHAFVYLRVFVCLCVSLLNGTRMPLFIEIFVYVCRYMALSTMCTYVSVASLFEVMSMTIWPFVYVGD